VLCDLVPGGHPKQITAAHAARILEQAAPSGAVAVARAELAAEFLADLRHLDAQLRDTRKKLAAAVKASGATLTDVFGIGPVNAGTIIGDAAQVSRFPGRYYSPGFLLRGTAARCGILLAMLRRPGAVPGSGAIGRVPGGVVARCSRCSGRSRARMP